MTGRLRGGGTGFAAQGFASGFGLGPNGVPAGTYNAAYAADLPGRRRAPLAARPVGPTLDPTVVGLWGEGFGTVGTADRTRDRNAATLDRTSGGFVAGIEATFEGQTRIGVAGGWSEARLDLDGRASRAEITSGFGAIYGATSLFGFALRAGAAGASHDIDTRR